MDRMDTAQISALFESVANVMSEKSEEMCEMDALMGDGDLGLTMKKGFEALPGLILAIDDPDAGKKLAKAGMKMSSVVPSTMGTLMSSGIISGGKQWVGLEAIDANAYLRFLQGFCEGIIKRGKCERGDRTVLDSVASAADYLEKALADNPNLTLQEAGDIALAGAEAGVEATRTMEPKFGKAAVHKATAVGVPDQGACAGMYLLRGFRNFFHEI